MSIQGIYENSPAKKTEINFWSTTIDDTDWEQSSRWIECIDN